MTLRSSTIRFVFVYFLFVLTTSSLLAQSKEVHINITEPDQYASRIMTVVKKSGKTARFRYIKSFNPQDKSITFEQAGGATTQLSMSEIRVIRFTQTIKEISPMAQERAWEILTHYGEKKIINIHPDEMTIKDGLLVLTHPDAVRLSKQGQLEVTNISYDSKKNMISVELQAVVYEKKVYGGGPSQGGAGKGLQ